MAKNTPARHAESRKNTHKKRKNAQKQAFFSVFESVKNTFGFFSRAKKHISAPAETLMKNAAAYGTEISANTQANAAPNDAAHTAGSARTRVFVLRNARKSSMESSRKFSIKAYSMYTCIVCPPSASLRPQTHFTYDYSRKNGIKKCLFGRFLAKKGDKNVQKHGKNKQNEGKITSKQRKNGVNTYKKAAFFIQKRLLFLHFFIGF